MKNFIKLFSTLFLLISYNAFAAEKSIPESKEFREFWKEFKGAVKNDDREKVAQLTKFPFKDKYREVYRQYGFPVSAKDKKDFIKKYDYIFTEPLKELILNDRYSQYEEFCDDEACDNNSVNAPASSVWQGAYDIIDKKNYGIGIRIEKPGYQDEKGRWQQEDKFKLSEIPYFE